jgi:hypothetical protein
MVLRKWNGIETTEVTSSLLQESGYIHHYPMSVTLNGTEIEQVTSHNLLGVTRDQDLKTTFPA